MRNSIKDCMIDRARELRTNSTNAEIKLWSLIRRKQLCGHKFKRQYIIGSYIVDFVCIQNKLVIELDGSQHLEAIEYDQERTNYLNASGFVVLRFWNNEVLKNVNAVLDAILNHLKHPLPF